MTKSPLSVPLSKLKSPMLDRVLSMRRSSPHTDETSSSSFSPSAASTTTSADGDDSKTKKQNHISIFLTRILNNSSKFSHYLCLLPFLFLCLLIVFFIQRSRNLVCVNYDPVSRALFFGFDGLDSDFGSLGVPWCT